MSLRPWLAEHGCSAATSVLEVNGIVRLEDLQLLDRDDLAALGMEALQAHRLHDELRGITSSREYVRSPPSTLNIADGEEEAVGMGGAAEEH